MSVMCLHLLNFRLTAQLGNIMLAFLTSLGMNLVRIFSLEYGMAYLSIHLESYCSIFMFEGTRDGRHFHLRLLILARFHEKASKLQLGSIAMSMLCCVSFYYLKHPKHWRNSSLRGFDGTHNKQVLKFVFIRKYFLEIWWWWICVFHISDLKVILSTSVLALLFFFHQL